MSDEDNASTGRMSNGSFDTTSITEFDRYNTTDLELEGYQSPVEIIESDSDLDSILSYTEYTVEELLKDKKEVLAKTHTLNSKFNQTLDSISDTLNKDRSGRDEGPFLEFLTVVLKEIVYNVLKLDSVKNRTTLDTVVNFLESVVRYMAGYMQAYPIQLAPVVSIIIHSPNAEFYQFHDSKLNLRKGIHQCLGELFAETIDIEIVDTTVQTNLECHAPYFQALYLRMCDLYGNQAQLYISRVLKRVTLRYSKISEVDLVQLKKEDLKRLLSSIRRVTKSQFHDWTIMLEPSMTILLRMIKSNNLVLKVYGMSELKILFKNIVDDKNAQTDFILHGALCDILRSENLLGFLFETNVHAELVGRSDCLIEYLIFALEFTEADLSSVWSLLKSNQHVSVMNVVFPLLMKMVDILPVELLFKMFELIELYPQQQYDTQFAEFIFFYFKTACTNFSSNPDKADLEIFCVKFYAFILQIMAFEDSDLLRQLYSTLSNLLLFSQPSYYKDLIKEAVKKFKSGGDQVQAALMIQQVTTHQSLDRFTIVHLLEECDMLSLVFQGACKFITQENAHLNPRFQNDFTHINHVIYGLISYQMQINEHEFDAYFKACILDQQPSLARDAAFLLLTALVNSSSNTPNEYTNASLVISSALFDRLLVQIQVPDLSPLGLKLVETCFIMTNSIDGNFFVEPQTNKITVLNTDWKGKALLFSIAFFAQDSRVVQESMTLFSSLYLNVNDDKLEESCLSLIKVCMSELTNKEDSSNFERSLHLLKTFMDLFNKTHGASNAQQIFQNLAGDNQIRLLFSGPKISEKVLLSFSVTDPIGYIKSQLAKAIGLDSNTHIRLFSFGCEWRDDMKWYSASLTDKHNVLVQTRQLSIDAAVLSPELVDIKPDAPVKLLNPSDILGQPKYFDMLYEMLNLDTQRAEGIWSIIKCIPGCHLIYHQIESAESSSVAGDLLTSGSALQILYKLIILNYNDSHNQDLDTWHSQLQKLEFGTILKELAKYFYDQPDSWIKFDGIKNVLSIYARKCKIMGITLDVDSKQLLSNIIMLSVNSSTIYQSANLVQVIFEIFASNSDIAVIFSKDMGSFWTILLIEHDTASVRELSRATIVNHLSDIKHADLLLLSQLMLDILPATHKCRTTSAEYFDVLNQIIGQFIFMSETNESPESHLMLNAIVKAASASLLTYVQAEIPGIVDETLCGIIQILNLTVESNTHGRLESKLLDRIFLQLLFAENPGASFPICKSKKSREFTYKLLNTLMKKSISNMNTTVEHLDTLFLGSPTAYGVFGYVYAEDLKSSSGYVGLVNQGATCYMNSIMQQFFMNPNFRSGIFSCEYNAGNIQDDLVYQLVYMFTFLQESTSRTYDTIPFCAVYKDTDGVAMNPHTQMDVDEFFNVLFDRLEKLLVGKPGENIFKESFGGKIIQEIKSFECSHVSTREENYFALQLEVKGKINIYDSLATYVEGENLDGDNKYFCGEEGCKKQVDALKRSCIKELPNSLIMHLKRFDFDMETLQRIKLNDYFEFPHELDLTPYTLDYIHEKEAGGNPDINKHMYKLSGVLVHAGTADSGHYYSFIRARDGNQWLHFNDSNVELFDVNNLGNAAFGGLQGNDIKTRFAKHHNAYMLFYDRVGLMYPDDIKAPDVIQNEIHSNNTTTIKRTLLFDPLLSSLMNDLQVTHLNTDQFNVTLNYLLDVSMRTHGFNHYDDILKSIVSCIEENGALAEIVLIKMLSDEGKLVFDYIFMCYFDDTRNKFIKLVMASAEKCWKSNSSLVYELCDLLTSDYFICNAPDYWRVFESYFDLLADLAQLNLKLIGWMEKSDLTAKAMNIFLENFSPVSNDLGIKVKKLGDRVSLPEYSNIIRLVSIVAPYHSAYSAPDDVFFKAFLGEFQSIKNPVRYAFLKKMSLLDHMEKSPNLDYVCRIVDEMILKANGKELVEFMMHGMIQDELDNGLFFVNCLARFAEESRIDLETTMESLLPGIIQALKNNASTLKISSLIPILDKLTQGSLYEEVLLFLNENLESWTRNVYTGYTVEHQGMMAAIIKRIPFESQEREAYLYNYLIGDIASYMQGRPKYGTKIFALPDVFLFFIQDFARRSLDKNLCIFIPFFNELVKHWEFDKEERPARNVFLDLLYSAVTNSVEFTESIVSYDNHNVMKYICKPCIDLNVSKSSRIYAKDVILSHLKISNYLLTKSQAFQSFYLNTALPDSSRVMQALLLVPNLVHEDVPMAYLDHLRIAIINSESDNFTVYKILLKEVDKFSKQTFSVTLVSIFDMIITSTTDTNTLTEIVNILNHIISLIPKASIIKSSIKSDIFSKLMDSIQISTDSVLSILYFFAKHDIGLDIKSLVSSLTEVVESMMQTDEGESEWIIKTETFIKEHIIPKTIVEPVVDGDVFVISEAYDHLGEDREVSTDQGLFKLPEPSE